MTSASPETAIAIATEVRAGLDAREVTETHLARIAALNPALNALCFLLPNAVDQASRVMVRCRAGEYLPLAGVPIVIKDNIWAKDGVVTQGSRLFAEFRPPQDARAVHRLRQAGAVIIGIGNCSEFACKGVTSSPLHGITHHPLDPTLTPGGSSGGPSVAVASGMVPLALGTDAGGSSRRPPAHVGVVGFKPGQDIIPYGPGFAEPFWNTSVLAPIAANVADTSLMFAALTDHILPSARPLDTLRIGYAPTMGLPLPLDPAVASAMEAAIDCLRAAGLQVTEASPDWPDGADPAGVMPLQAAGLAHIHGMRRQDNPDLLDPDLLRQIEAGQALSGADVARALDASAGMRTGLRAFFQDFDLILSPTSSTLAWPHNWPGPASIGSAPAAPRDHAAFTPQFNHAGLPAISIPCGAPTGLPVGLQIGAAQNDEMTLLAAAAHFEELLLRANLWPAQLGA